MGGEVLGTDEVIQMPRSLEEIIARQNEFADAFERAEPAGDGMPEEEIAARRAVRAAARDVAIAHLALAQAVSAARAQRLSWRSVGEELGTSGEAARQRFARIISTDGDD